MNIVVQRRKEPRWPGDKPGELSCDCPFLQCSEYDGTSYCGLEKCPGSGTYKLVRIKKEDQ